jgi:hypothetical protein
MRDVSKKPSAVAKAIAPAWLADEEHLAKAA